MKIKTREIKIILQVYFFMKNQIIFKRGENIYLSLLKRNNQIC